MSEHKLTEFSKGSGCGCKLAPAQLQEVLSFVKNDKQWPNLLVGNGNMDDAAVMEVGDQAIISTTDFFMPIVDDARDFGAIAAVNAMNDVYAMGGKPVMALAILGWPIEQLGAQLAGEVVDGAREICEQLGVPLAGGHSIDSKEPIFGLAVTGVAPKDAILTNSGAREGDLIYMTKPLGVGIIATAQKRKVAEAQHVAYIIDLMKKPNAVGTKLSDVKGVHAVTDITGFGLAGHLLEMSKASGVQAQVEFNNVPTLPEEMLAPYLDQFIMPDNTMRNFSAYSTECSQMSARQLQIMCDPQTSGGLLISVDASSKKSFEEFCTGENQEFWKIGEFKAKSEGPVLGLR